MPGDADSEHRGVAEPEGQSGQEADLGDVDRVQPPGRIDPIPHRAAGEDAGADIVSDRIGGEGGERVDAIGNMVMTDRAHGKQVVEGEGEITGRHEQRGQRNLPRLGLLDGFEHLVDIDAPQHVVEHVARDPDHRDADHNTQLVQDLLLAQKRDRPAYCFQHLDLELAIPRRRLGRTPPTLRCFLPSLVARFGPEWNSPDANKTRFFSILAEHS